MDSKLFTLRSVEIALQDEPELQVQNFLTFFFQKILDKSQESGLSDGRNLVLQMSLCETLLDVCSMLKKLPQILNRCLQIILEIPQIVVNLEQIKASMPLDFQE